MAAELPLSRPGFLANFNDVERYLEQLLDELDRARNAPMRFRGAWQQDVEYFPNDVVRDDAWLMIANQRTFDRAQPIPDGNPFWVSDIPGTPPAFTINSLVGTVIYGNRFTWSTGGFVRQYRWYAPDDSGNFTYEVWAASLEGTLTQLVAPAVPGFVGWQTIPQTGIWGPGNVVDLVVVGRSVTQPSTLTANWQTVNANTNPGEGEAIFRNNQTECRVSNIDSDAIDRESQLQSIAIGASMECGGLTWTVTGITTTGTGASGRHNFTIEPNQGRPPESVQPITWQWGSAAPVPYPVVPDWYSGAPYPNGDINGFFGTTYPPTVLDDSFYGVDVELEGAIVSNAWDWMAFSG